MDNTGTGGGLAAAEPEPQLLAEPTADTLPAAVGPQDPPSHSTQVDSASIGWVVGHAEPEVLQAEPLPGTSETAETGGGGARPREAVAARAATAPVSSGAQRKTAASLPDKILEFSPGKSAASSASPVRRPARRSALPPPPTVLTHARMRRWHAPSRPSVPLFACNLARHLEAAACISRTSG